MINEHSELTFFQGMGFVEKEIEYTIERDSLYRLILHDLKNPVLGIYSLARHLQEQPNTDVKKMHQYNGMILSASESLLSLIDSFQIFLHAETQDERNTFKYTNLNGLISSAIASVCANAERKNIIIHCNLSSFDTFYGSEFFTSVILRNLLTNAIKFTPKDGSILVTTSVRGAFFEVSIKDSGIGMTQTDIGKLFNLKKIFTRLGTEKEKGTGLGLFFCREFIYKQNGTFSIESVPGLGSNFIFTLPLIS
ncbi:MAG TPA: HAMP domain-containing sensor histidine kinase [Leptospiraceae bacterium]|nr:HAMP domain-containing sensor histidine kinase [Leptospiraceae bacterium]HMX34263.1 HAMP domain-containing sensor histidine kinase [Leptospiraceae bacterium]HMY29761.1 HAMP domain-containing sensor histidine kinase [Leptospiraceae bacterium]HMZ62840.1 HAMP domain-containing sensor histidine kinase [Leptospiraceae bacterium]HNA06911.1 HAMP domain-containing sensor histidine kinase [Leptospiraceae bacterium]